jgi:hypothetical protein
MFLGGLWHGVGLTFMAWGLLHGVALALHKVWLKVVPGAKSLGRDMKPLWRVLATLFTFHVVAFGWLLFTAHDMTTVVDMLHNIVYNFSLADVVPMVEQSAVAMVLMAIGYLLHALPRRADEALRRGVVRIGFVGQWLVMVVTIWMVMQCNMLLAAEAGTAAGLPIYAAF